MTRPQEDGQVPGPPRGRRQLPAGDLLARVQAMRDAEVAGGTPGALLAVAKDVIWLLKDCAVDPRVPRRAKLTALAAAVYAASPLDLIPDVIPVIGQLDDLGVLFLAFRHLVHAAGYDLLYELWRGTDEGLALVLTLAGVQE